LVGESPVRDLFAIFDALVRLYIGFTMIVAAESKFNSPVRYLVTSTLSGTRLTQNRTVVAGLPFAELSAGLFIALPWGSRWSSGVAMAFAVAVLVVQASRSGLSGDKRPVRPCACLPSSPLLTSQRDALLALGGILFAGAVSLFALTFQTDLDNTPQRWGVLVLVSVATVVSVTVNRARIGRGAAFIIRNWFSGTAFPTTPVMVASGDDDVSESFGGSIDSINRQHAAGHVGQ
jgi:hypothetical protein